MSQSYEAKTASIVRDVSVANVDDTITYKASLRSKQGLEYAEPVIMIRVASEGCTSGWFDAELIAAHVNEYRESLIERLDPDFIPKGGWEIKV